MISLSLGVLATILSGGMSFPTTLKPPAPLGPMPPSLGLVLPINIIYIGGRGQAIWEEENGKRLYN